MRAAMHGILLCAGQGSRLLPLTDRLPKCLVEVGGRAILEHQLEALASAGVSSASVIAGYRHAQVAAFLDRPLPLPVDLVLNPFWSVSNSIGSVWAVRAALDAPFVLANGDTVFDPGVLDAALAEARAGVRLLVEPIVVPDVDDMRVSVSEGRVLAVSKTLDEARTTHRSLGVIVSGGGSDYRASLQAVIERDNGHAAFHHAVIDLLARAGAVGAVERGAGAWQEFDRPEDLARWDELHRR